MFQSGLLADCTRLARSGARPASTSRRAALQAREIARRFASCAVPSLFIPLVESSMNRNAPHRRRLVGVCGLLGALALQSASAQTTGYALLTPDPGLAFVVDGPSENPSPVRPVLGVLPDDVLVAIDVRPQTGQLYALAHDPKTGSVRLYRVDTSGSAIRAAPVGTTGSFVDAAGNALPIFAQSFDIDFNPTVDRLRVITSGGLNFRMNPNNGALVDGNFNNAVTPPAGVNPDANLNGGAGGAMGTAYTNNAINVAVTTQYTLDHDNDTLTIQNPPNAGTLTAALPVTSGGVALNFGAGGGLDIEPGINATASGMPGAGRAVAVLTVGGQSRLYRIDLADGVATSLGGSVGGLNIVDVAVSNLPATASALSLSGTQLTRFAFATPGASAQASVTGVVAGERLVGFDVRPATGQLYALGIDAANDRGTVYVLEPQSAAGTAQATAVGLPGRIAWVDDNGVPIDLSDLPLAFDFNPAADRIRIVDASGLNARANPNDGAPVDGNAAIAGTNPDGSVQAEIGTQIVATAYASNTSGASATTQYTLDQSFARLSIQNPPNSGTQSLPLALTIFGTPFVFSGDTGFDIPPGPTASAANAAVNGQGYFTANDPTSAPTLYEVGLADGIVLPLGAIASNGQSLTGLAVHNAPVEIAFAATSLVVDEGTGAASIGIVLLNGGSTPVRYRTTDGSAVAGRDYEATQGTLFLAGAAPQATIEIPLSIDALDEPDETFDVVLDGPFPGPLTLSVTIRGAGDAIFQDGFEEP
jgi:hypothetical protein